MENVRGLLRYQQVYRQILISYPQTGWHVGHDVWSHHHFKNQFAKWLPSNSDTPRWWVKYRFQDQNGLYEWMIMRFDMTNASNTFIRVMTHVWRPLMGKFLVVYFDDILIYSKTLEHHVGHLRQICHALWTSNCTQILRNVCSWLTKSYSWGLLYQLMGFQLILRKFRRLWSGRSLKVSEK